jgi:hypothetical protein
MFQIVQYLFRNNFETVKIKRGNNCGPRAIAVKAYGSQANYKQVRREVQSNLIKEYKAKDSSPEGHKLLKEYKDQCRQQLRFTEQEL